MAESFLEKAFDFEAHLPEMGIIAMAGAQELGERIDKYLVEWYNEEAIKHGKDSFTKKTFLLEHGCLRFTSGDAKALIKESVRGMDIFIICDVGNYSIRYNMYGMNVPMSPDDHYADLKRIISAIGGKANSITVLMPILYGGRQHKRSARESLDCAMMLQELEALGVSELITFDAHDPRVQNATPLMGFDNFMPSYQIIKALLKRFDDLRLDKDHFMIVSPDEGAMNRNTYYASILGLDLGMFYKRRDYSTVVNGRNPIVAHEYIGDSPMGLDVFVADDLIATGDSLINLATHLKERGANRIFLSATFGLFTEGLDKFRDAYQNGLFDAVITTNLTYVPEALRAEPWFIEANMAKYGAYIISATHQKCSVSKLLDPHDKIKELVDRYKNK